MKRARAQLQVRTPAPRAVREWGARIEALEADVAAILAQERDEMELRRAEMQALKVPCQSPLPSGVNTLARCRSCHV